MTIITCGEYKRPNGYITVTCTHCNHSQDEPCKPGDKVGWECMGCHEHFETFNGKTIPFPLIEMLKPRTFGVDRGLGGHSIYLQRRLSPDDF